MVIRGHLVIQDLSSEYSDLELTLEGDCLWEGEMLGVEKGSED